MIVLICWAFGALAIMEVLCYMDLPKWKFAVLTILWPLLVLFMVGFVGWKLIQLEINHVKEKKEAEDE